MVNYLIKILIIYIAIIFFFITYNYTSGKKRYTSIINVLEKVRIFNFYIFILSISSFILIILNKVCIKLYKNYINKTYLNIFFAIIFIYLLFKILKKISLLFFKNKASYLNKEISNYFDIFYKNYVKVLKFYSQLLIGGAIFLFFSKNLIAIKPYFYFFLYLLGGFILYFIYCFLMEKIDLLIEIIFEKWLKIVAEIVYRFKLKKETFKIIPYVTFTGIMLFTLLV